MSATTSGRPRLAAVLELSPQALFQPASQATCGGMEELRTLRLAERMAARRDVNVLAPVLYNAVARKSEGRQLTPLEADLLACAERLGTGEAALAAQAEAYRTAPSDRLTALFPTNALDPALDAGFHYHDLAAYLLAVQDRLDSAVDHQGKGNAVALTGNLVAVDRHNGGTPVAVQLRTAGDDPFYCVGADSFYCREESNEASASDEVYWIFGATDVKRTTYKITRTYEDVDAGELHELDPPDMTIWVEGEPRDLVLAIEAWEEDFGKDKVRSRMGKWMEETGRKLREHLEKEWPKDSREARSLALRKLFAACLEMLGRLIGDLEDDLIEAKAIAYSADDLRQARQGDIKHTYNFSSRGNGSHDLHIRILYDDDDAQSRA